MSLQRPSGSASDGSPGPGPERQPTGLTPNACETRPPPPRGEAVGPVPRSPKEAGAARNGPRVIASAHELILWTIPTVGRLPRHLRYTLGERIESRLYSLLEHLIQARFAKGPAKLPLLDAANVDLEVARHALRLAWRLRVISLNQLEHFVRLTDDVGRQVGAWRRASA